MNFTKRTICIVFALFASWAHAKELPELMLMGTFHFSNPGLDVIKTDQINVMTDESQEYLIHLSKQISQFKPTSVLLEFNPKNTDKVNQMYQSYLEGNFELPSNEIFQIGFRVAKFSGVKRIESLDERSIPWKADGLYEYMENVDTKSFEKNNKRIAARTAQTANDFKTLTLQQLLQQANQESHDKLNKSGYLSTNAVGVENGSFVGADAAASWWHRNFRIYAKIQKHAENHQRIFALAGQGHTAILKDFLSFDQNIQEDSIQSILQKDFEPNQ